jgi:hypothetical protein
VRTWPADSPSWAPRPAQEAEPNHTDPPLAGTKPGKPKEREALGRSRGGLTTVYSRHRRWSGDGSREKIVDALRVGCDEAEGKARTVAADATVVRAHQHAAGARHAPPKDIPAERLAVNRGTATGKPKPGRASQPAAARGNETGQTEGAGGAGPVPGRPDHQGSPARGRRLPARVTSAGQRHDSVAFVPLMGRLAIARRGRGRPRTRPGRVRADKAYSGKAIRSRLRRRGIRADYPRARRPDPQPAQARQRGRPAARVRPRRVQAAQYRRARLLPAPPAPRRRHPVRQARLRLPRHRRRGSDPDLAPRPHTTRSTGHALVRGSGRAACR